MTTVVEIIQVGQQKNFLVKCEHFDGPDEANAFIAQYNSYMSRKPKLEEGDRFARLA